VNAIFVMWVDRGSLLYLFGLFFASLCPFMQFHLCHLTRASSRSPVSFIKPLDFACAHDRM